MTANIVDLDFESNLQKTVENIANKGIAHAILISLMDDNSIKINSTADLDLTEELIEDALIISAQKAKGTRYEEY
jgi:hypothetical protein